MPEWGFWGAGRLSALPRPALRPLVLVGDGAFPDDGMGAGQLPPLRVSIRSSCFSTIAAGKCCALFQPEIALQQSRRLAFRGHRPFARRPLASGVTTRAAARRRSRSRPSPSAGNFSLIEVMLPRGATSDTLARFVTGFKAARETHWPEVMSLLSARARADFSATNSHTQEDVRLCAFTNSCGSGSATIKVKFYLRRSHLIAIVGSSSVVGGLQTPGILRTVSPSKFCSPLEVDGPRGFERLDKAI